MKAIHTTFRQIIQGTNQFIVPVFQRDYRWEEGQFEQLWHDITKSMHSAAGHFLGSIVYIDSGNSSPTYSRWLVIDGQQRLATLTVLVSALRDKIKKLEESGEQPSLTSGFLDDVCLKNPHHRGDDRYKLMLRRADSELLQSLIDGKGPELAKATTHGHVLEAYKFFQDKLGDNIIDLPSVFSSVASLRVVEVTLDRGIDDPQLVFESLNSTGVDLSQSDLVRNYLLMGLSEADQTRLYNNHWSKLKDVFRRAGSVPDTFLRDYVALKQGKSTQIRADDIYDEFKDFHRPTDTTETESLLADMVQFGWYYAAFLWPDRIDSKPLKYSMQQVHGEGIGSTHATLVMRLYDCYQRRLLSEADFIKALTLIKSYLIRRAVLRLQTRDYWGVFARTAFSVSDDAPLTSLQVALAQRGYRFPSDEDFKQGLQESEIYGLRICFHLLEQLENAMEEVKSPTENCSVEHIMPQSVDDVPEWKEMIGDDWEQVHKTWLHRLGNLTLVGYKANSSLSNRSFQDKKTMPGGFEQSPARLNYDVRAQERWAAMQIEERGRRLADRALRIWPHHGADEKLVRDSEVRQLRALAAQYDASSLKISFGVRELLEAIQTPIRELGDVIEVIEHRSVCCYDYSARFFAELLPMASYVRILIPVSIEDVHNPDGLARDTTEWKFLPNVRHRDCGVFFDIWWKEQIPAAIALVRQAFNLSEE